MPKLVFTPERDNAGERIIGVSKTGSFSFRFNPGPNTGWRLIVAASALGGGPCSVEIHEVIKAGPLVDVYPDDLNSETFATFPDIAALNTPVSKAWRNLIANIDPLADPADQLIPAIEIVFGPSTDATLTVCEVHFLSL